jgi:general secretion pathway protein B
MSYILDALKKAEADRQLGALPGLHGQPQSAEAPAQMRVWLMLIAALLALIAGLLLWRSLAENSPTLPPVAVVATGSGVSASMAASLSAVPVVSTVAAVVESAPVSAVVPSTTPSIAVVAAASTPVLVPPLVPPVVSTEPAKVSSVPPAPPVVAKAVTQEAAIKADVSEESLPLLSQLPELIQREVPPVAIKGFMYSQNPADRILVVGSNFHHEGDELAAGVKLEKLLPNAAILNFKGFRYRIAY